MRNLTFLHFEWNFIYFFLQKTILFLFGVLCGSIDWASKIFYCFFCHFWAQNQFECVPDVVCKVLLCVQFSLKFWVVYLFSNLLQLTVESRTWFISSSEKKNTVVTSWANSPNDNAFQSKLSFFHHYEKKFTKLV